MSHLLQPVLGIALPPYGVGGCPHPPPLCDPSGDPLWAQGADQRRRGGGPGQHDCPFVGGERGGPYRFVRHPGYLGSLLCLNGLALASGNALIFVASVVTTFAAYAYRIHVEDAMLVAAFSTSYESYRREVGALWPFVR